MNIYRHNQPFELERGGILPELTIAFSTYGKLNAAHDNVIWVCHALTADSDVASWWPHTVEAGKFLDPAEHFIICANILGSHYGTTGPLHVNPATGRPYYKDFPELTIRDMVRAHRLLADILGIHRIHTLVGSSVGGFQAVEWAVQEPERIGKLVLIATAAKASPWSIAIDETQRMAIEADSTFGEPYATAGMKGLAAARAIGLLSYRGPEGYDLSQQDESDDFSSHRACTYPKIESVNYPGLKSSPFHDLAKKYLTNGFGGVLTFRVKGSAEQASSLLNHLEIISHLANVGDTRSLLVHPASTTHSQLNERELVASGVYPNMLRFSLGIEHIDDLKEEIGNALKRL